MSVTVTGFGQFMIAAVFLGSVYTLTGDYVTHIGDFGLKNSHLLGLSLSPVVANFTTLLTFPGHVPLVS